MFITNSANSSPSAEAETPKLSSVFAELTPKCDRFDMLVGFFFFSGFKFLTDALKANPATRLRVLVGMGAEAICGRIVETVTGGNGESADETREEFLGSLRRAMSAEELDKREFHERIGLFVELLESGRLEMRRTVEPNHAKLYLFHIEKDKRLVSGADTFWITGSSNFSEPGLSLRNEFNVGVLEWGAKEAQKYFDDLWATAVSLTEDEATRKRIVRILGSESVASAVTPYEAYLLVLRTYVEHQTQTLNLARAEQILRNAGMTPMKYQLDAVAQALAKLEAYHGCILADVVGLGKSVIASLLGALSRKRGLVLCPPGLMGDPSGATGGWYQYKRDFRLDTWEIHSRGNLDAVLDLIQKDPDFDLVVIDEAHAFRSRESVGYDKLSQICAGRDVLLLSATPFNNRPDDLYALLTLFSPPKHSPFVPGGDLEGRFRQLSAEFRCLLELRKAIARKDWAAIATALRRCGISGVATGEGADLALVRVAADRFGKTITKALRQIMEKIVIRRNRLDLLADPEYRKEVSGLSRVRSPKAQYFELTREQNEFYDRVINDWFGPGGAFHGAVYRPYTYEVDQSGQDNSQQNIFNILRSILVLRFESSFGAFKGSVSNILKFLRNVRATVNRLGHYVYARDIQEKIQLIDDDLEAIETLNRLVDERLAERERSGRSNMARDLDYNIRDRKRFRGEDFLRDLDEDIGLLERIVGQIRKLRLVEEDPKADALVAALRKVVSGRHGDIEKEPGAPKRKVIVFTAYTDTLKHLHGKLAPAFAGRVLAISGENFGVATRGKLVADFDASKPESGRLDDYDILLATDKLSEGFNLNRAGLVVNYDIPWNPTRVIQRVGRINRIGRKVFDNLYIFNFFPTLTGQTVVQNKETAQAKMFAIHEILGEDAQIFSPDETPTPAALFEHVGLFPEEKDQMDLFSQLRAEYVKQVKWLSKNHPEVLEKLAGLPPRVKTAWTGNPHGTFMFRRLGPGFFALAHNPASGEIEQWTLEEAVGAIRCDYAAPAAPFGDDFWTMPDKDGKPSEELGVYKRLQDFRPKTKQPQGGVTPNLRARQNLAAFKNALPPDLAPFARDLEIDLREYLTLPPRTVFSLGEKLDAKGFEKVLRRIQSRYRPDHFARLRARLGADEIIATIQKN